MFISKQTMLKEDKKKKTKKKTKYQKQFVHSTQY